MPLLLAANNANSTLAGSISNTAYGIWQNSATSFTICGGTTNVATNNLDDQNRPIGQAYLVDYDTVTKQFTNWKTFEYPNGVVGQTFVTHFEGITGAGGAGNYNVIGDYFDLKNKTLEYGFFLPVRNWTAGTATVIGPVSANSVYGSTVIGVYIGAGLANGYITTIR